MAPFATSIGLKSQSNQRVKDALRRIMRGALELVLRFRSKILRGGATNVMIVAPHPDDEAFGCAGLILSKRESGAVVRVVYLTDGSASHPKHPRLTSEKLKSIRRGEAEAAMSILGVQPDYLRFLDLRDGTLDQLTSDLGSIERINEVFRATPLSEIYLPSRRDGSSEHEAAFILVRQAIASAAQSARVFQYLVWSWWSPVLLHRALAHKSRVWRVKVKHPALKASAIAEYRSQIEPTAPWTTPVLPPGFAAAFAGRYEYFLEERSSD